MIFVEFNVVGHLEQKKYFVGKDWVSIFADTNGGRQFGFTEIENRRMLSLERIRRIAAEKNFEEFLDDGIKSVREGKCDSYSIN